MSIYALEIHTPVPTLTEATRAIARHTLPSTSRAHATLSFAEKEARWSIVWGNGVMKISGAHPSGPL